MYKMLPQIIISTEKRIALFQNWKMMIWGLLWALQLESFFYAERNSSETIVSSIILPAAKSLFLNIPSLETLNISKSNYKDYNLDCLALTIPKDLQFSLFGLMKQEDGENCLAECGVTLQIETTKCNDAYYDCLGGLAGDCSQQNGFASCKYSQQQCRQTVVENFQQCQQACGVNDASCDCTKTCLLDFEKGLNFIDIQFDSCQLSCNGAVECIAQCQGARANDLKLMEKGFEECFLACCEPDAGQCEEQCAMQKEGCLMGCQEDYVACEKANAGKSADLMGLAKRGRSGGVYPLSISSSPSLSPLSRSLSSPSSSFANQQQKKKTTNSKAYMAPTLSFLNSQKSPSFLRFSPSPSPLSSSSSSSSSPSSPSSLPHKTPCLLPPSLASSLFPSSSSSSKTKDKQTIERIAFNEMNERNERKMKKMMKPLIAEEGEGEGDEGEEEGREREREEERRGEREELKKKEREEENKENKERQEREEEPKEEREEREREEEEEEEISEVLLSSFTTSIPLPSFSSPIFNRVIRDNDVQSLSSSSPSSPSPSPSPSLSPLSPPPPSSSLSPSSPSPSSSLCSSSSLASPLPLPPPSSLPSPSPSSFYSSPSLPSSSSSPPSSPSPSHPMPLNEGESMSCTEMYRLCNEMCSLLHSDCQSQCDALSVSSCSADCERAMDQCEMNVAGEIMKCSEKCQMYRNDMKKRECLEECGERRKKGMMRCTDLLRLCIDSC
eukprot:MONOS_15405.1-p1 / transcript=MONOS_15405.1 / gene=MONOS_15405 / organism=Monocercomonoides_exilis_PA203 / gene_product=unspecified product / transcript_product=unspecified product / location=Mono_scaffold01223:266-3808(-) / protein_length=725 / sequence_SO=supercontig / SO=protein_coding / is_pseudo=false